MICVHEDDDQFSSYTENHVTVGGALLGGNGCDYRGPSMEE